MTRDSVRAFALTALVAAGLAGLLWWDATRSPSAPAGAVSPQPVPGAPHGNAALPHAPRPPASARRPASGTYKCEIGGRTTYQADPCPPGAKQSDMAGGSMSVVSPPSPQRQLARVQALGRATGERSGAAVAFIETESEAAQRVECESLRKAIDRVDALGRQPNTAQSLEWLREKRREYVRRANELDCPRMSDWN